MLKASFFSIGTFADTSSLKIRVGIPAGIPVPSMPLYMNEQSASVDFLIREFGLVLELRYAST